jgi:hypothetical protein
VEKVCKKEESNSRNGGENASHAHHVSLEEVKGLVWEHGIGEEQKMEQKPGRNPKVVQMRWGEPGRTNSPADRASLGSADSAGLSSPVQYDMRSLEADGPIL